MLIAVPRASRASARARCSRSRSRSSATCSRPAERGSYQGLFGAVFGISFIIGPALGGFLTDNVSWHWIFYVNLPIGIVSLFVICPAAADRSSAPTSRTTSTTSGAVVFTVAIGAAARRPDQQAVRGLDRSDGSAASSRGAVVLGVLFVAIESRAKEPIVPLGMFRNRTYSVVDPLDVPRELRVLRGDHLPAALVPVRQRLERHRVRLPDLRRCSSGLIGSSIVSGHPRVADRPLQGDHPDAASRSWRSASSS